jgi:hypothetical protein
VRTHPSLDHAATSRVTCRRRARVASLVVVLACGGSLARLAHADGPAATTDVVAAEAMFEEGRKLVAQGKYAEACPKFADSQRLDPSPGTLLNLASCWEKLGRTATAWATYRAAASSANASGRKDYIATAQKHAETLAPRLAHLTLNVPTGIEGLLVKRDGLPILNAEWGLAIPVDVGGHAVEASAPGYKGWVSSVDVPAEGASVAVTIPPLEALPREPTTPAALAPAPTPQPTPPSSTVPGTAPGGAETSSGGGQRTAGLVVAGAGIVGLGVGAILAISAKSTYNDSLSKCEPGNPGLCTSPGVGERDNARTAGDAATVAFVVGGAAVAAGAVVWILAPRALVVRASTATMFVAPSLGGAVIGGAW